MTTTPDNTATTTLSSDTLLNVSAPPDATEVYGWAAHRDGLAARVFEATVREASGYTVAIHGVQRENGACQRWAIITAGPGLDEQDFEPQALRQLAAALVATADEIEARR